MVNVDVLNRLIDNLKLAPIEHDQTTWLRNCADVFTANEEKRWSCATAGCAAGFIFLQEAPAGYVLDADAEKVFSSIEERTKHFNSYDYDACIYTYESGETIWRWAADVAGIEYDTAYDLFFDFGDTDHIVRKIEAIIARNTTES